MMKQKYYPILGVIAILSVVLISGCVQKECETDADCLTKTCFTVQCTDNNCTYSPVTDCCGNEICEEGVEEYSSCSTDCPNCEDYNECTMDWYNYHEQKCINKPIVPCCGNGICEINEDYKSCPEDGCLIPMVFGGVGEIGHGTLLDSGEIEFKEMDLRHDGGFYMANIYLPIKFQTKTKDITLHLWCVNKETRYLLFSSMEEKTVRYEFSSQRTQWEDYVISGTAEISGEDVVFNTGQTRGTKIIEANNGETAVFVIQFGFDIDSSISLECEAGIVAEEPVQSIKIPLDIKYIKS